MYALDRMLARLFRHASAEDQVRGEAFLEEALAAALCEAGTWARIVDRTSLDVPRDDPELLAQEVVAEGRTDITLRWPGRNALVLELKQGLPPDEKQIRQYLESERDVVAVAKYRRFYDVLRLGGFQYRGLVTWRDIRDLDWIGAPRAWKQLHALIDEMGVAMQRVTLGSLTAMVSSWDAWGALEAWAENATNQVAKELSLPGGTRWVTRDRRRTQTYQRHQLYARWLWTHPWRGGDRQLTGLCGLFVGRTPHAPVRIEGAPDLFLSLRSDPAGDVGRRLEKDEKLRKLIDKWRTRADDGVLREAPLPDSQWEFLRVRCSAVELLRSDRPDLAFAEWAAARAKELVSGGVIGRLVELEAEVLAAVPAKKSAASGPDEDHAD